MIDWNFLKQYPPCTPIVPMHIYEGAANSVDWKQARSGQQPAAKEQQTTCFVQENPGWFQAGWSGTNTHHHHPVQPQWQFRCFSQKSWPLWADTMGNQSKNYTIQAFVQLPRYFRTGFSSFAICWIY